MKQKTPFQILKTLVWKYRNSIAIPVENFPRKDFYKFFHIIGNRQIVWNNGHIMIVIPYEECGIVCKEDEIAVGVIEKFKKYDADELEYCKRINIDAMIGVLHRNTVIRREIPVNDNLEVNTETGYISLFEAELRMKREVKLNPYTVQIHENFYAFIIDFLKQTGHTFPYQVKTEQYEISNMLICARESETNGIMVAFAPKLG